MGVWAGRAAALGIVAGSLLVGGFALTRLERQPRTDDASIEAEMINVAPEVPGRVVAWHVHDNQAVRRGDVLFQIDPEPYRLRLRQAEAEMRAAEAEVAQGERTVTAEKTNASVATAQVDRARANVALTAQTLARMEPLLPQGYVTAEQVDQARTANRDAEISLRQAQQQADGATRSVGNTDARLAHLESARATVALAEHDLQCTTVRAPFDGKIVGLKLAEGEYAIIGRPLFALIDTEHWYAVANFRETELAHIHAGDGARVYVMADRGSQIEGVVESIGWGVNSTESVTLQGTLPYESRSLNWVRIAQRFPVRILLSHPPEPLMRVGASAVVVLKTGRPEP